MVSSVLFLKTVVMYFQIPIHFSCFRFSPRWWPPSSFTHWLYFSGICSVVILFYVLCTLPSLTHFGTIHHSVWLVLVWVTDRHHMSEIFLSALLNYVQSINQTNFIWGNILKFYTTSDTKRTSGKCHRWWIFIPCIFVSVCSITIRIRVIRQTDLTQIEQDLKDFHKNELDLVNNRSVYIA